MPIYEYACKKCGKVVDLLQKMGTEAAGIPCPECSRDTLAKKLSVTSPAQMAKGPSAACSMPKQQGACGGCCAGCQ